MATRAAGVLLLNRFFIIVVWLLKGVYCNFHNIPLSLVFMFIAHTAAQASRKLLRCVGQTS